jgi:hypothetical protein
MPIRFNDVASDVQSMGRWLSKRDPNFEDRLEDARAMLRASDQLPPIDARIRTVRQSKISGYRGATPLPEALSHREAICQQFPLPPLPPAATLVAVDGSQIYPDRHSYPRYYLLNIGIFTYYHGVVKRPEEQVLPKLYFTPQHLRDNRKHLISRRTVDARRSIQELQALAKRAHDFNDPSLLTIALLDNRLLFFVGSDVTDGDQIMRDYAKALKRLHRDGAILAGYVDSPQDSRQIMRLLYLMSIAEERLHDVNLRNLGAFEAVTDVQLLRDILPAGARSAMMVQNSPANFDFKETMGDDFEIAFFFLNVGAGTGVKAKISRVDIPMWVARQPQIVDHLHALIVSQCVIQGNNPYPYAITRADELAYVSGKEKQKLDDMIRLEMRKHDMSGSLSTKQRTKNVARGERRRHELL